MAGDGWRDEEVGGLHPPYGRPVGPLHSNDVEQCYLRFEPGLFRPGSSAAIAWQARKALKLAHFGPLAEAAIKHSQSHGALAFMATEHGTGSSGAFRGGRDGGVGDPRRTTAGSETRAERRRARRPAPNDGGVETRAERRRGLDAMFLNFNMNRPWEIGSGKLKRPIRVLNFTGKCDRDSWIGGID